MCFCIYDAISRIGVLINYLSTLIKLLKTGNFLIIIFLLKEIRIYMFLKTILHEYPIQIWDIKINELVNLKYMFMEKKNHVEINVFFFFKF